MATDPTDPQVTPEPTSDATASDRQGHEHPHSRSGAVWTAVVSALILLVLLIVFFVQNDSPVMVTFFGFEGSIALGLALLIAAVGGGIVVALVGLIRIIKLRAAVRRSHR